VHADRDSDESGLQRTGKGSKLTCGSRTITSMPRPAR